MNGPVFDRPGGTPQAESSSGSARQMPGQVPGSSAERSGFEARTTDQDPPDSNWVFKYGPAPGQYSNVPGTTPVSPNGTGNAYGTGGRPIRITPPEE